jgi:hypothetical protein
MRTRARAADPCMWDGRLAHEKESAMARNALCIGINDYPGTSNDLSGCVNDANDWAAELGRRGFAVTKLLDAQATKAAIEGALRSVVGDARQGDSVVITYSGHGTWVPDESGDEPDKRDEALCPYDLQAGPLVDDTLYEIFSDRARGVKVVFLSDSCHSGTVSRYAVTKDEPRRIRFLSPENYEVNRPRLQEMRRLQRAPTGGKPRAGALLISGCADFEYSYDATFGGRPNGAFTRAALDALRTLKEGASYREWFAALRAHLPSSSYPQTPNLVATSAQRKWKALD